MVSLFRARAAVLIVCISLMPLGAAQAQGLFDFLFSRRLAPSLYYFPTARRPGPPWPRMSAPGQHHVRVIRKARIPVAANHAPPPDIMTDRTLRDGDAVMTAKGLRIFAGEPGSRHRPEDFAPLFEVRGLSGTERAALAELDKRVPLAQMEDLATGRSVATPDIQSRRLIEDPRHGVIRYVGP